jgi:hypothetical protein
MCRQEKVRRLRLSAALSRKRPRLSVSLLCALLALGGSSLSAQEMPTWKFRPGASFTLEHVQHQNLKVDVKDKVEKSELTTTWLTRIDVQKVSDKQIILEQTIVSLTAKGDVNKESFEAWAAKMKEGKFRVTVSPAGRVLAFEGHEEFIKKIEGLKHHADHAARVLVSESALKQTLEDMLGFLPEKAVQPKETWQRQTVESIAPFGSFKLATDYIFKGRRDGAVVIAFSMQGNYVLPKTDLGVLRVLKGTIKPDVGQGEILFDPQKGLLIRGEKKMHIHGDLTMEAAPERTIRMTFDSEAKITWRLIDK